MRYNSKYFDSCENLPRFPVLSIKYAGGTSDLMYKICKAQIKQGHDPYVYTGDYKFDSDLASTIPQVKFKILKSYFDKEGFSIMPKLPSVLENEIEEFDIIHMHVFRTFQNLILYFYCKKFNVPYVLDAHGAVPYYTRKGILKRLFDKLWVKNLCKMPGF